MKLIVVPSLKRLALVNVVAALWNQTEIRESLEDFPFQFSESDRQETWQVIEKTTVQKEEWLMLEEKGTERASQLSLPEILKEKVKGLIRPIGLQILKWMAHYPESYYLPNIPAELHWTPYGTIDREKMAEKLFENEDLDILVRFRLACTLCMKDVVFKLWKKVPDNLRENFSHKNGAEIYNFWYDRIRGKGKYSFSRCIFFKYSAICGNKAMSKYFFEELSDLFLNYPNFVEGFLVDAAKLVKDTDHFCFLLSQMSERHQIEALKGNLRQIIECFLYWPFQCFLGDVVGLVMDSLCTRDYRILLESVVLKIEMGFTDWNYHYLFQILWEKCSYIFKTLIMSGMHLIKLLLRVEDKRNFKYIIHNVSPMNRKELIHCSEMKNISECLFFEGEYDFLKYIIEICLPADKEKKRFKNALERRRGLRNYLRLAEIKQKWDQLFPLSDEPAKKKVKKRKYVADTGIVTRRRCTKCLKTNRSKDTHE